MSLEKETPAEIDLSNAEEILAHIAAVIRERHAPDEFPAVIAWIERHDGRRGVTDWLRRALYS